MKTPKNYRQVRNVRVLEEGEFLTLSVEDTGSLIVSLSEFRQYLREPGCEEELLSLCKAFCDIESNSAWRMTIGGTPKSFSAASTELTEWITLVSSEDRFTVADRWFRVQYGKEDPLEDLIKYGEVVFTRDKLRNY